MPEHVRKQLREALKTSLFGNITDVGDNVFIGRVYNFSPDELPAITIYTIKEEVEIQNSRARQPFLQQRAILNSVLIVQKLNDAVQDDLDRISAEVENKIFADPSLGGIAHRTVLVSSEMSVTSELDKPLGVLTLNFLSYVLTKEGASEKAIFNSN